MYYQGLPQICSLIKKRSQCHRRKHHYSQYQHGNQGWNTNNSNQWQGNQGFGQNHQNNPNFGNNQWGQQPTGSSWGSPQLHGNHLNGLDWVYQQQKRQSQRQVKHNFDMNEVLNFAEHHQVVFVEPSPVKSKLEQLKNTGQTFTDDLFPPNDQSLSGQYGPLQQWKDIQWVEIYDKIPNSVIFSKKIGPKDIKQGYLGDCYFLAGLAALAERPDRIFNLFLVNQQNEQHYFSVKMLYKGKWLTIDMDENIPFLYNQPAFSKAQGGQLWVVLLEKAWAKMYTNYKRIDAGFAEECLHDLTGAPVRTISIQQAGFDKNKEWDYLMQASQLQYAMCASSQPGSDTQQSIAGVVLGHAYTLMKVVLVNAQGNQVRLVQLRNPWGKTQGKGQWSDFDSNWNSVSQAEKQRIGYFPDKDDGIFFLSYDDFCAQFRAITVAQIDDNSSYVYKSVKDPQSNGCYFKVTIAKEGNYSFHIDKTPDRSYQNSVQQQFQYPMATFQIGKVNQQKLASMTSGKRTLYKDLDLAPGQYIVFAKIDYDAQFEKDFDVNLAVYAEFPCQISLASHNQAVALSGDQNVQWTGQQTQSSGVWNNLSSYNGNNQGGNNSWNNQGNQNNNWGNQGNQGNNNDWGNQGNNNNDWGNQGNNNNNNWGNQGNNDWGNQGNNNGWGNQGNNNNWGNQGNQGNLGNNGWGNQGNNNDFDNILGGNNNNNNGWGNQGNNNDWGNNQGGNNNGWGNQNVDNGWDESKPKPGHGHHHHHQNPNNGW